MAITRGKHLIGKTLGTCVLERLLGYGGSSAVFLAQEHHPERKVAVKVFLPRANFDARMQRDFYLRFLHEARSASKLSHPNILPLFSYGEEERLPYIVMPYMPGGTLGEYISHRGRLPLPEVQWYLEQLSSALDYAHEQGCVHCDVKPANILRDNEGHVLLSDFGIARIINQDEGAMRTPEPAMGTPDYISPEQALGQALDGRSDVYSLGITIYLLLAGQLPFNAESPIALALLHVHEAPPSLALMRGDITPALDRVIQKALAKNAQERYQTAGKFCVAFTQAIQTAQTQRNMKRTRELKAQYEGWGDFSTETHLPVIAGRPMVQVKPLKKPSASWNRLLLIALVCLVVIATAIWAFPSFKTMLANRPTTPTPIATSAPTSIDLLADKDRWPVSSTFFFAEEQEQQTSGYHIINTSPDHGVVAPYYEQEYTDFQLQVTMTKTRSGGASLEYHGVIFRALTDQSRYYLFEINPENGGSYAFLHYDGQRGEWTTIKNGTAPSLQVGIGKPNTIEIKALDNAFSFSINAQPLVTVSVDSKEIQLTKGMVGLYVENQGVEVIFSEMHMTMLP